ncbi:response regulator transcription factor [Microvirga pudoricolor]|uniref:response regulator transcription factor n=1 Tax=Microvirga pudoricolor TaxID=2778729 RepID=UPI00194DBC87|nr:response regulator transcription factor [Microvirga pudoricolor]MBM6592519.1 response regulator transcription factor [Microvirga pudoricolor]
MTAPGIKVLVVDDEPPIRRLLRAGLTTQDYVVHEAGSVEEALDAIAKDAPDVMLLDLGLPGRNGMDFLAELRDKGSNFPILILSSRTDETGIVQALELGADDYITKPFGMKEVIARLRVAIRHRLQQQGERPIFQVGALKVDLVRRTVTVHDQDVRLSPREYEILRVLVQHAGKVLTHRFIIHEVWGGPVDAQNLRVHIRQLRQKLESDPEQPALIHTETGVGYRLQAPD